MSYFNTILPTNDTTYSSAFPPLQSLPLTVNHHQQHHKKAPSLSSIGSSGSSSSSNSNIHSGSGSLGSSHASPFSFFTSLAPPKFPSYLKHTAYADIVLQQYNDRKCKKQPSSDMDLRLPQYWNKISKSRHPLQIGINGYDLSYNNTTGPTSNKKEQQAAEPITCHTNFPARPQCGVYYFEIRVLHLGQDGIFAIGFSRENHKLNKLPGCDSFSYGYHGYDGQIYQQDTKGAQYGPTFTSGDVIGCGINYANHSAFFTKNGVSLGVAFESIDTTSELLYPCVGLSTAGEAITANFGQEPFAFDIVEYVKSQQLKSMHESTATLYPPPTHIKDTYKNDVHADVDQLVLSYLLQQGYTQTAVALLKNIQQVKQKDLTENYTANEDQLNRNAIRKSIMKGSVDAAIEQTKHSYPGLLENNPDLMFQLKSRKFLDILIDSSNSIYVSDHSSDTDDDTLSTYSGRSRGQSFSSGSHRELHDHILYEEEEEQEEEEKHHTARKPCPIEHITTPPLPAAASGRRLSWAAIAAPPSFDTTVVEEMFTPTRRKSMTRMRRDSFCSIDFFEDEEHHHIKKMSVVRKAMNYGHILQEEYQHDSKYLNKLMELFTLIAYNDPKTSPMAHLLDISQRDGVATELNKAIQMYQGQPPDSSLDLIYKQSIMTNEILIYSGHGKASLLHMKSYFGH